MFLNVFVKVFSHPNLTELSTPGSCHVKCSPCRKGAWMGLTFMAHSPLALRSCLRHLPWFGQAGPSHPCSVDKMRLPKKTCGAGARHIGSSQILSPHTVFFRLCNAQVQRRHPRVVGQAGQGLRKRESQMKFSGFSRLPHFKYSQVIIFLDFPSHVSSWSCQDPSSIGEITAKGMMLGLCPCL